jgi:hypothetical protein
MKQSSPFKPLIQRLRATAATFPDKRKGKNTRYTLVDAALGAFAVFFIQSPSFLAHQRALQARTGQNNAHTLFGLRGIPCDNQMRTLRDPVRPEHLVPLFHQGVTAGRTRWKVENENNTTLKPKGYHRLYVHPRGLVWGFDPRGDVKPPYVKELVQLVEAYGLDEQNE